MEEIIVPPPVPAVVPIEQQLVIQLGVNDQNVIINKITKITFKQIFENFIYQNVKQLNNISIDVDAEVRNYFIYLCKERGDFFTHVEKIFKKIVINNKMDVSEVCLLMELVVNAYKNIKIDKEEIKNADPIVIIKTMFIILIMLYIQTNDLDYDTLFNEMIKIVEMSIELIKVKPIKASLPEKMTKMFYTTISKK